MAGPVILDALAGARLVRLVTRDRIASPVRERIIEGAYTSVGRAEEAREFVSGPDGWAGHVAEDDDPPKLAYAITCPWCVGVWVALLVPHLPAVVKRTLALALLASTVDRATDRI